MTSFHHCHAIDCGVQVAPSLLFCGQHWRRLSAKVRDAIWREYRPGQERDKKPSNRYMAVQRYAVTEASFLPNDEARATACAAALAEALRWRSKAIAAGEGDPLSTLLPPVQVGSP